MNIKLLIKIYKYYFNKYKFFIEWIEIKNSIKEFMEALLYLVYILLALVVRPIVIIVYIIVDTIRVYLRQRKDKDFLEKVEKLLNTRKK